MKKLILLICLYVFSSNANAKIDTSYFWIQLKDKDNCGYSIKEPEKFLTERAIIRRNKNNWKTSEADLPITQEYVNKIAETGVEIMNKSKWFNAVFIRTNDEKALETIKKLKFVSDIKPLGKYVKSPEPNIKSMMMEEALRGMMGMFGGKNEIDDTVQGYGKAYNQIEMLNGIAMHQKGFNGKGVVIAILDAGFTNVDKIDAFEKLRADGRLLGTWDFVKQESTVFEDNNHGLNVLSCIGANSKNIMIGTAPEASFWLLRTEDANSEYPIEEANWICGAEFADSVGADIANSSLGYSIYDDKNLSYTKENLDGKTSYISRAANMLSQRGVLLCNAAGNEGDGAWKYVGVPADADNIISVGGVDKNEEHASFSSYGPTADGRIKPTVCAKGERALVIAVSGKPYYSDGTSFASPILCGMVACLVQANPTKSVTEIIEAVKQSADRSGNPDTTYGYGIPDFILANRILGGDKDFNYNKDELISVLGNEMKSFQNIQFYSKNDQSIKVGLLGANVNFKENIEVKKGFNTINLNTDKLPLGNYVFSIISEDIKQNINFTIVAE